MSIDILWQIAALIHQLPADAPTVSLAVAAHGEPCPMLDVLKAAGGDANTSLHEADAHDPAHAIDSVWIEVDGVEFSAQASRDLTDAEQETLEDGALARVADVSDVDGALVMNVRPGADIWKVCLAAANLAARKDRRVRFVFNETPVEVEPEDSAREIGAKWSARRAAGAS